MANFLAFAVPLSLPFSILFCFSEALISKKEIATHPDTNNGRSSQSRRKLVPNFSLFSYFLFTDLDSNSKHYHPNNAHFASSTIPRKNSAKRIARCFQIIPSCCDLF